MLTCINYEMMLPNGWNAKDQVKEQTRSAARSTKMQKSYLSELEPSAHQDRTLTQERRKDIQPGSQITRDHGKVADGILPPMPPQIDGRDMVGGNTINLTSDRTLVLPHRLPLVHIWHRRHTDRPHKRLC